MSWGIEIEGKGEGNDGLEENEEKGLVEGYKWKRRGRKDDEIEEGEKMDCK